MNARAGLFSLLIACTATCLTASLGVGSTAHANLPLNGSINRVVAGEDLRTTDACFIVYKSYNAAAIRCPIGAEPSKVHDFWTGQLRGYSCRCKGAETF